MLLFDAVGTVLFPAPPAEVAYAQHGQRWGSALTAEEIRSRFRVAFRRQETVDHDTLAQQTSENRERLRWATIVAEVFVELPETRGLFEALWSHFARPEHWQLFLDARALLPRLTAAGVPWGLASNFDARLHALACGIPELRGAREVLISSELGHRKPSPLFFARCEERLMKQPSELALVGDDLVNDFRGAQQAGWRAVQVLRLDTGPRNEERIASLLELETLPGWSEFLRPDARDGQSTRKDPVHEKSPENS